MIGSLPTGRSEKDKGVSQKKLLTIADVNEERQRAPVIMVVTEIVPEWRETGIESGLGGELLELFPQPLGTSVNRQRRVKCSHTHQESWMLLDGSAQEIILGVGWDAVGLWAREAEVDMNGVDGSWTTTANPGIGCEM